jgi:hypothetical protein
MTLRIVAMIACIGLPSPALAQDEALAARVMQAVWDALAPALPYPVSDDHGLPAGGNTAAPWMVRPLQPGDRTIEVLANPLNEANQRKAERAMAQIDQSIQAAQRRADLQYERAIAEAKRTGTSQEVDGVTLSDEGLAGARIDAESHVTIEVMFNQPSYRVDVASGAEPSSSRAVAIPGAVAMLTMTANAFRDGDEERWAEGESQVYLGRVTVPRVRDLDGPRYEVTAAATPSDSGIAVTAVVLRVRGNEALTADILRKANWPALLELLK